MSTRHPATNTALTVVAVALAVTAYGLVIAPAEDAEARRAIRALGYRVDEIHRAPLTVLCAKNRTGYVWRSGQVSGQACVGGFMPPGVEVW
ncbi:hypothetical protein [uncultured Caulobacter sp.]|uniref:hypothetical protein n=1 Tax=uncultured Caulobacter sp. TaxID=158749 RepID=UPI002621569B|nr:hypothetical protein [uncultured Caulobacter sp.]